MRNLYAYAFSTALSPADLAARLRDAGVWMWIDRDSDRWGDYVSSIGVPGAIIKIVSGEPVPDRCVVNVRFESDADDAAALDHSVRRTLLQRVLPAIGARDVVETGYLE